MPSVLGVAGLEIKDPRFAGPPRAPPVRYLDGAGEGIRSYPGHLRNVPEIDAGAAGSGLYSLDLEGGVARRLQMVGRFDEATVPTLSVEMIRVALDAPLTIARARGGTIELRFGDYVVPAQPDGKAYVRYGHSDPGRFVSAARILDGTFDVSELKDRLVIVGFTGLGLVDLVATPLGETVFGVENHAQAAEAILEGQLPSPHRARAAHRGGAPGRLRPRPLRAHPAHERPALGGDPRGGDRRCSLPPARPRSASRACSSIPSARRSGRWPSSA